MTNPYTNDAVGIVTHICDGDDGDGMKLVMAPHYFRADPMTMYICRPDRSASTVSVTQARGGAAL